MRVTAERGNTHFVLGEAGSKGSITLLLDYSQLDAESMKSLIDTLQKWETEKLFPKLQSSISGPRP